MNNFAEEGIVFPRRALATSEASALVSEFNRLAERMSGWTDGAQVLKSHLVSPWVCSLVCNSALLNVIEEIIGPDILCWSATFFAKAAGTDGYVGWHQDLHYWGLEPPEQIVTAWLGLTDAREDNGGMFCIPGSHLEGDREHRQYKGTSNMLLGAQETPVSDEELSRSQAVVLDAGEFSVHHPLLLHGSYGNHSARPRIGLSVNYIGSSVRQTTNGGVDSAMLVRGEDRHGHFNLEPKPRAEFDADGIVAYKKALLTPSGIGGADDSIYEMRPDLARIR